MTATETDTTEAPDREPRERDRRSEPLWQRAVAAVLGSAIWLLGVLPAWLSYLLCSVVAAVVGGVVVAWLSKSSTAVSGPAAGLTAICVAAIASLGWEAFLLAVFLAGRGSDFVTGTAIPVDGGYSVMG